MHRRSLYAALACCIALVVLRATSPPRNALTWDVFGYYLYLPATFIHHDIALEDHAWLDRVMDQYEPSSTLYQLVDGPDGKRVIKYSAGMAVLYAPFFLVAHLTAPALGFPADGFSPPYQYIIGFGCLLYALLGLFVLRRVLLHFFNDTWTALLILLVVFGTNFLQLIAWDGTLLLLIAHALAKAGMFLAAGNLVLAVGSPHIADLTGISRFRPLALMSFGLAGVSLMGLPPSAGFTAKWLLLQSALASGQWLWIGVLLGGGLLSAAYVFRVFRHAFVEGPIRDRFASPPLGLELAALLLGSASIGLGLAAQTPLAWLRVGSIVAGAAP